MEGIIFLWLFWMYWILATFFMAKNRTRLFISITILIAIIFSTYSIEVLGMKITLTTLYLLLISYIFMAKQKERKGIYLFIASFIIMLAFTTFHLFELYDPVWIIFNRNMMLAFLLTYLTLLLYNDLKFRIVILICGTIHGEFLYAFVLKNITSSYLIGSFAFFDVIALSVGIMLIIHAFKRVSLYFEYQIKHLERGKQKPS
ncbi:hypothetical protein ABE096_03655 [Robertmurraya massiliosenegalensis]|uniref:YphA family membrane protein n=1 Tax=Robertmurraya TaxID=2837507 RepID=UPI0039A6C1F7